MTKTQNMVDSSNLLDQIPDQELGRMIKEYVKGNVYDVNWEGFTRSDLTGIRRFWADFFICKEAGL